MNIAKQEFFCRFWLQCYYRTYQQVAFNNFLRHFDHLAELRGLCGADQCE